MKHDLVVTRRGAWFGGRWFPCSVGRGGIGEKQAEGDGITPRGRHRIEAVLVRPDRTRLRGAPIRLRDGWSDDPGDPAYNCPVSRPHPFRHEALRRPDPLYDMIAVLDWNRAPVVPGKGSAIFLHVWRRPRFPTAGCVAFDARDLAFVLRGWTRRSTVVIRS